MGIEIITGHTGKEHVRSEDDASLYKGLVGEYGSSPIILDTGELMRLEVINSNTVRILDGDVILDGHQARIRKNDYEDMHIENGEAGRRRTDAIMLCYEKDNGTGIESVKFKVVKGEPEFNERPTPITRDNYKEYPLYFIEIEDLSISRVIDGNIKILSLKELHDFYRSRVIFETGEISQRDGVINKDLGDSSGTVKESYKWVKFADGTVILTGSLYVPVPTEQSVEGFERYEIGKIYMPDVVKNMNHVDINCNVSNIATITSGSPAYESPEGGYINRPVINGVNVYVLGQLPLATRTFGLPISFEITGTWKDPEELSPFHSVSNSKILIAAAITDMGVATSSSASYETMAENIRRIESEQVVISGLDTSLIYSTQGMFRNSSELNLDLSFFNTSNVTDMSYMFDNSRATVLDLSSFDTSNVTQMYEMFNNSSASTLDISSFDTSKVFNMGGMFNGMDNLGSLDVSHFDTSNVDTMPSMFSGLKLDTLDLSNFDLGNVIFAYSMFKDSEINNLNIPFNMRETNGNYEMFMNFKGNITQLPTSIEFSSSMFENAEIPELDFSNSEVIRSYSFRNLFKNFKGNSVTIPNWDITELSLLHSAESMFEDAQIDELTIGSLDISMAISAENMFRNAKLSDVDLSGVTFPEGELNSLFENAEISSLTLPKLSGDVSLSYAFKEAKVDSVDFSCGSLVDTYLMFESFTGSQVKLKFDYVDLDTVQDLFFYANVDVIDMSDVYEHNFSEGIPYAWFSGCTASVIYVGDEFVKALFEDLNVNPDGIPVEIK